MMILLGLLRLLIPAAAMAATGATPDLDAADEVVTSPRVAQVRLAEVLASADAIHAVRARGGTITFAITRGDAAYEVRAAIRVRGMTARRDEIIALAIAKTASDEPALGGLSWIRDELAGATAVTRLHADDDGAVTLTTSDGRRYMLIPGRGSGGNTASEARFAAEFDR